MKTVKFCEQCRPRGKIRSKSQICEDIKTQTKLCTACLNRKNFTDFPKCNRAPDGKYHRCKKCHSEISGKIKIKLSCQNPNCGVVFTSTGNRRKFCYSCNPTIRRLPDKELKSEMRKYDSRNEFARKDSRLYTQAKNRDWYKDFAQELWGDPILVGFSRSSFVKVCKRNNNGLGSLYLINCWMGDEVFYKIGFTSLGIRKRYKHWGDRPNSALPYFYEVVWTIEGDPGEIWDLEKRLHKQSKKYRYQPKLWPNKKARETFKCHGNCRILRKPIKNPPK